MTFVYRSQQRLYNNAFISGQYPRVLNDADQQPTLGTVNKKGNEAILKGFSVTGGPIVSRDLERKIEQQAQQQAPQLLATFLPITKSTTTGNVVNNPPTGNQPADQPGQGGAMDNKQLDEERNIKDKVIMKETSKVLDRLKKESKKKPTKAEQKKGSGLIRI